MTTQKLKAVVTALRQEGMSPEEILEELGSFLKFSQKTINAMLNVGMSSEEILNELTSDSSEVSVRLEQTPSAKAKASREDIGAVKKYLREVVGIPTHVKGYKYIATAIYIWKDGMAMTKELYPMVAKEYGTTSSRVERAIRHAVEIVFDRNFDFSQLMGNSVCPIKGKPTNAEFITALVEIFEQQ